MAEEPPKGELCNKVYMYICINQTMLQSQSNKTNGWSAINLNASKINPWVLTEGADTLFILELEIDYSKEAIAHKYRWHVSL